MRHIHNVSRYLLIASSCAGVALVGACGLDVVGEAMPGVPDAGSTTTGDIVDAAGSTTDPSTPSDNGPGLGPEVDATAPPSADAAAPDDPDAQVIDAAAPDAATHPPNYRKDWFDLQAEAPLAWNASWWKADTCRNKPGAIGHNIGPKVIDKATLKEQPSPPDPDLATEETLLQFPRPGTWPDGNGATGIAEPLVIANVRTNAFCARFAANLALPAGNYELHYAVSDSLLVFIDGVLVQGSPWLESTIAGGYSDSSKGDPAVTIAASQAHDVRVYYNNVAYGAALKVSLEGPL